MLEISNMEIMVNRKSFVDLLGKFVTEGKYSWRSPKKKQITTALLRKEDKKLVLYGCESKSSVIFCRAEIDAEIKNGSESILPDIPMVLKILKKTSGKDINLTIDKTRWSITNTRGSVGDVLDSNVKVFKHTKTTADTFTFADDISYVPEKDVIIKFDKLITCDGNDLNSVYDINVDLVHAETYTIETTGMEINKVLDKSNGKRFREILFEAPEIHSTFESFDIKFIDSVLANIKNTKVTLYKYVTRGGMVRLIFKTPNVLWMVNYNK